jgi:hypothetical protein
VREHAPPMRWRQPTNQHQQAQATVYTNSVTLYRLRHPGKTRVFDVADKLERREMARLKRIVDKSLMHKL